MKKRTDQIIDCINSVIPVLKELTDKLDEVNTTIKKNVVDSQTLRVLEKISRDVHRDMSAFSRAIEAHSKTMVKIAEELKE